MQKDQTKGSVKIKRKYHQLQIFKFKKKNHKLGFIIIQKLYLIQGLTGKIVQPTIVASRISKLKPVIGRECHYRKVLKTKLQTVSVKFEKFFIKLE